MNLITPIINFGSSITEKVKETWCYAKQEPIKSALIAVGLLSTITLGYLAFKDPEMLSDMKQYLKGNLFTNQLNLEGSGRIVCVYGTPEINVMNGAKAIIIVKGDASIIVNGSAAVYVDGNSKMIEPGKINQLLDKGFHWFFKFAKEGTQNSAEFSSILYLS